MLTNADAKAARPRDRAYKLHDAGGLHLFVAPTGRKTWRLVFRWRGREQLLTLGHFPDLGLSQARTRRDAARADLADGVDPRRTRTAGMTFADLARRWHAHSAPAWSARHAADVLSGLERDFFPELGARPIGEIEPPELLEVLRKIERRGAVQTAKRVRQRLAALFAYGRAEGLCPSNPACDLAAALAEAPPARPMPALETISECRELLAATDLVVDNNLAGLAHRFLALTAVRAAAVLGMRWSEIVDLNVNAPVWVVPAARMKLKRAKKGDAANDHVVPLSAAAISVLERVKKLHLEDANLHDQLGGNPRLVGGQPPAKGYDTHSLVFPIAEGAIGDLITATTFAGRHVPHGWRASFSTILNEDLGEEWARTIDRALAHSAKDKVEAAYNRAQLLDRRRQVMDRWGALLTNT
jgi:integrase